MNTPKKAKDSDFYMIDTLAIRIRYPNFKVLDPQLFSPALIIKESPQTAYNFMVVPALYGRNRFKKYTQNMTANDKKNSVYKPKLTAYQRFDSSNKEIYDLHIEFSSPKSIFGNSVREVGEEDLRAVVCILKRQLGFMGIEVSTETLIKAVVVKAHFSKNIPLKCTYKTDDQNFATAYLQNKKYYAEITSAGKLGYIILIDNCLWSWSKDQAQGVKMCFQPKEGQDIWTDVQNQDKTANVDYNCAPAIVNDSVFTPPSNIKFSDFSELMKQATQRGQ